MTVAPLPAPLPETLKPEWVAETDWRAENDRASAFEHGVIDAGDGLVIILASTDYFYDEEPSRILRFRDELCAAWNRCAPEAQAWRDISTAPRDGTHVLLLTTDHGAVEAWFSPGEWNEHHEFGPQYDGAVWVCGDDAWQIEIEEFGDSHPEGHRFGDGTATHWQPLPAPPSATPAAPPAREAALVEALQFYADRSNWKRGSDEDWSQADTDGGQIARAALAEAEGRA